MSEVYKPNEISFSANETVQDLREQTNYTGTIMLLLLAMALQFYNISFPIEHSNPWQLNAALMVVVTLYLCVYVQEYMAMYVKIDKI